MKQSTSYYDSFKIVITDVKNPLMEESSDNEQMRQLYISMLGEENPIFLVIFTEAINPQLFIEDPTMQDSIPADTANQLQSEYDNKNTELIKIVSEIFGNPDNYVHLSINDN